MHTGSRVVALQASVVMLTLRGLFPVVLVGSGHQHVCLLCLHLQEKTIVSACSWSSVSHRLIKPLSDEDQKDPARRLEPDVGVDRGGSVGCGAPFLHEPLVMTSLACLIRALLHD